MRMSALHLGDETFSDIGEREHSALLGKYRVEEHLQQQIAELLAESAIVSREQRLVHLVRLLDEVRSQGFVGLRGVPFTSAPQIAHERERIVKGGFHGFISESSNCENGEWKMG